jgi:hypothetical protein
MDGAGQWMDGPTWLVWPAGCAGAVAASQYTHEQLTSHTHTHFNTTFRDDIERVLGDNAWCITASGDGGGRCFGYLVSRKRYVFTLDGGCLVAKNPRGEVGSLPLRSSRRPAARRCTPQIAPIPKLSTSQPRNPTATTLCPTSKPPRPSTPSSSTPSTCSAPPPRTFSTPCTTRTARGQTLWCVCECALVHINPIRIWTAVATRASKHRPPRPTKRVSHTHATARLPFFIAGGCHHRHQSRPVAGGTGVRRARSGGQWNVGAQHAIRRCGDDSAKGARTTAHAASVLSRASRDTDKRGRACHNQKPVPLSPPPSQHTPSPPPKPPGRPVPHVLDQPGL